MKGLERELRGEEREKDRDRERCSRETWTFPKEKRPASAWFLCLYNASFFTSYKESMLI